ncbi:MAG: thioredoxin domain-containing protein [Henriciella sp.]|uniref:thioredoxin domain-containing protein n=1 Tax=Henriciella sp. TaxID=1968823 RepID=UPI003C7352A8
MKPLSRHAATVAVSMLALAACGNAEVDSASQTAGSPDAAAVTEMSMGADDAPVTVIEYASWTCPACLQYENDVVGQMKEEYVETGKVKFIFREYPTAPVNITVAGFAIARCAGEDKYFDVLDELFSRQTAILAVAREGGQVKAALQQVAANHGITDEAEFDACLQNRDIRKAIAGAVAAGDADGVQGTPTVLVNGQVLPGYEWRRLEGMRAVLDEALGEDAPAPAEPEAASAEDMESESGDAPELEPATDSGAPE